MIKYLLLLIPMLAWSAPDPIEASCGAQTVDESYAYGNLLRYGGNGNGVADNTAAWNLALCSVAHSPTHRVLSIPVGNFRFASRPAQINASVVIQGVSTDLSVLVADYDEPVPVMGFMQNIPGQGGLDLRNFRIHKSASTHGGAGIAIVSTTTSAAGFIRMRDVIVTTLGGTWNYALFIDGENKTTPPLGVRDLEIDGCLFFGATDYIALFYSVNATRVSASFFPAGGTSNKVLIGGTPAVPSNAMIMDAAFLVELDLGYVNGAKIRTGSEVIVNRSQVTLNTKVN